MKRAIAVSVLLAFSIAVGYSQSSLAENRALQVSVVDDEHVWKLEPGKQVGVGDVLGPYAEYKNAVLIANPMSVHGEFAAEDFEGSSEMRAQQIDAFAQSIIRKSHHELMMRSPGIWGTTRANDAAGEVAFVSESELGELQAWSYVTCVAGPYKSEPASLQHHVSRQLTFREHVRIESGSGYLFVSATVERVQELLKIAREYEEQNAIELEVYDLPAGVGDPEIATPPKLIKGRMHRSMSTPDRKRLIVRATRETHRQLATVVPTLKPLERQKD